MKVSMTFSSSAVAANGRLKILQKSQGTKRQGNDWLAPARNKRKQHGHPFCCMLCTKPTGRLVTCQPKGLLQPHAREKVCRHVMRQRSMSVTRQTVILRLLRLSLDGRRNDCKSCCNHMLQCAKPMVRGQAASLVKVLQKLSAATS